MKLDQTIDRVDVHAVALPTIRSFGVAGGSVAVAGRPSIRVLVKVSADGVHGWGEATPIPAWTDETAESIFTTITRYLAPAIIGQPVWQVPTRPGLGVEVDETVVQELSIEL